jgi:predicted N-acyltransferase
MTLEIKTAGSSDADEWDKLVEESSHATIFHTWKWLNTMQKHGGGRLYAVTGMKGNEAVASIPLFVQKKYGMKLVFSPPPQKAAPYLGPLFKGYEELKQSRRERLYLDFQEVLEKYMADEIRPDYVFVSTPPGLIDIRPWQWSGYDAKPFYEYVFDLTVGVDTLWSNLKKNLRKEVKRTQEAGVTVREGGREDFIGVLDDVKSRYVEQGVKDVTREAYLKELFEIFHPDNMLVLVAEYKGERVGGTIELLFKDRVIAWVGGVKSDIPGIFPNALVHWEGLRMAAESGAETYMEMGANTRQLCIHKRRFNPKPLSYFNLRRYPNPLLKVVEAGYVGVLKRLRVGIEIGVQEK